MIKSAPEQCAGLSTTTGSRISAVNENGPLLSVRRVREAHERQRIHRDPLNAIAYMNLLSVQSAMRARGFITGKADVAIMLAGNPTTKVGTIERGGERCSPYDSTGSSDAGPMADHASVRPDWRYQQSNPVSSILFPARHFSRQRRQVAANCICQFDASGVVDEAVVLQRSDDRVAPDHVLAFDRFRIVEALAQRDPASWPGTPPSFREEQRPV